MTSRESLWADFCGFATEAVRSGDLDPTYAVLSRYYVAERLDREAALWRTLLYLTFYHLGSASAVWTALPRPGPVPVVVRPTGTERRFFRGRDGAPRARAFIDEILRRGEHAGGLGAWVDQMTAAGGEKGWVGVRQELGTIPQGGPWTAYKFADLLRHVHGMPITAPDVGVGGMREHAGPVSGLVALTGLPWRECASNIQLQRDMLARAQSAGVPLTGLDQLETALCDFNSLMRGSYYVGHDIDLQMVHLPPVAGLWEARSAFPDVYRGELSGWHGVRAARKSAYRDRGALLLGEPSTVGIKKS